MSKSNEQPKHVVWTVGNIKDPGICKRKWKPKKPLSEAGSRGCLNCGVSATKLPLKAVLAVGFGCVTLQRCGKVVWCGDDLKVTAQKAEDRAKKDPKHDWRISFEAPLYASEYQRQGAGKWVLISTGMGFA